MIGRLFTVARDHWRDATRYQRLLYLLGLLLVTSGVFHIGVWLMDGGSLAGPVSWRKPIVFGLSGGITILTVGWVLSVLPRRLTLGWLLAFGIGLGFFIDVALIQIQQWRGVPSHFNMATPFDSVVFGVMGVGVIPVEVGVLVLAIWTFSSLRDQRASLAWAIRLGMALLVVSQIFGNLIIQNGVSKVFDPDTGEFLMERVRTAAIFGAAGSMKIPHALALHGIQVLPILALILGQSTWDESRRLRVVLIAALGYAGMVAVSAAQTFRGLAPFDLGGPAAFLLVASAATVAAAYSGAILGMRQGVSAV